MFKIYFPLLNKREVILYFKFLDCKGKKYIEKCPGTPN